MKIFTQIASAVPRNISVNYECIKTTSRKTSFISYHLGLLRVIKAILKLLCHLGHFIFDSKPFLTQDPEFSALSFQAIKRTLFTLSSFYF